MTVLPPPFPVVISPQPTILTVARQRVKDRPSPAPFDRDAGAKGLGGLGQEAGVRHEQLQPRAPRSTCRTCTCSSAGRSRPGNAQRHRETAEPETRSPASAAQHPDWSRRCGCSTPFRPQCRIVRVPGVYSLGGLWTMQNRVKIRANFPDPGSGPSGRTGSLRRRG